MSNSNRRYYVTFGIGMTESFDALNDADCDRIISDMVNSRDSLRVLPAENEVVIADPMGAERKATIGDYFQG